jgi:hypothetical protein
MSGFNLLNSDTNYLYDNSGWEAERENGYHSQSTNTKYHPSYKDLAYESTIPFNGFKKLAGR